jgi:uncharacterized lipoprotein YajG
LPLHFFMVAIMLKPLQSLSIAAVLAAGLLLAGCKDAPDAGAGQGGNQYPSPPP